MHQGRLFVIAAPMELMERARSDSIAGRRLQSLGRIQPRLSQGVLQ
jgi:hypothetical protein